MLAGNSAWLCLILLPGLFALLNINFKYNNKPYYYTNRTKGLNLKTGVGIDLCDKK